MPDLAALDAITEAVESGAGLPEVVRAAALSFGAIGCYLVVESHGR